MVFENLLDPVFSPLLKLHPLLGVAIISLIVALIITIVYKFMTKQALMKEMKQTMKEKQKQMRALKHEPKKMMAIQKEVMQINMKYMMHSFKPTIITLIPIIIIFGWLNANLACIPILPDYSFTTTMVFENDVVGNVELIVPEQLTLLSNSTQQINDGRAEWKLKGTEGEHALEYKYNNQSYLKEVLITKQQAYKPLIKKIKDDDVKAITINNRPLKLLNIFGLKLGWLWTYIIFSIVFSMALRKILKIY